MPAETSYTFLRENLANILDRVGLEREVVIVRRRGAPDVALIPADELAGLMETASAEIAGQRKTPADGPAEKRAAERQVLHRGAASAGDAPWPRRVSAKRFPARVSRRTSLVGGNGSWYRAAFPRAGRGSAFRSLSGNRRARTFKIPTGAGRRPGIIIDAFREDRGSPSVGPIVAAAAIPDNTAICRPST